MRVYIAGPMRNKPQYNFPAFDAARDRWKALGWDVISPADLDREMEHFDGGGPWSEDAAHMKSVIGRDLRALEVCDAIALLPDWQASSGARLELLYAIFTKMRIFDAAGGEMKIYIKDWSKLNLEGFMAGFQVEGDAVAE